MTTGGSAAVQLATISWLHTLFTEHHVDYWLFGGWAVDFHVGRVTRYHEDIDVAVWRADVDRIQILLEVQGWFQVTESEEEGLHRLRARGVRLELALRARGDDGAPYTPLARGRGDWPAGSFGDAQAQLDGVQARVVGLASLMADKSGTQDDGITAAKNRADVAVLAPRAAND
jgi:Aminoglycoside-2''-adenylyltransferase